MKLNLWQDWWRARRPDVAAVTCVALFFALFFARVFAGRRFIISGDSFFYSYPLRTVAWQMIRQGSLPLWTPFMLSGYPLLSVSLLAVGYPLTWCHLFLPGHVAEQIYALAPFLLSPLFTYAYAREVGRSRLAALLAGLSFGYGGSMCGILASSGMLTNSMMWTPLVLLFIDRARAFPLRYCLFWATVAYAPAVLAGHGQSYTYGGLLVLAYGLFVSLSLIASARQEGKRAWLEPSNWQPFVVACGTLLLAAGVAAFQLLEVLRVTRRSVRSALSYESFSEGSFTLREALLSVGAQLYHYIDTSTYVTPLALVLAAMALACALRGRGGDARVWFWAFAAGTAFILLLGWHTPLNRLVYHLPVVNKFRVPSRHTFEWTLAISLLAAYGWDGVASYFARTRTRAGRAELFVTLALLAATTAAAVVWWRRTVQLAEPNPNIYTGLPEASYWLWKIAFTALVLALTWYGHKLAAPRWRASVLTAAIVLACFVESSATAACWWAGFLSLPTARFQVVSPVTRYLQQFPPEQHRVYTRVEMFSEEFTNQPRLEAANLTVLYGLHNLAGIEPLILERYSRALGSVGPDSVTPRPGFPPNDDLFAAQSHVLDLLNTTHVVSYTNLKTFEDPLIYKDGVGLSVADLNRDLPPGATVQLTGTVVPVDQLALVTSLANSVNEPQGTPVARVRLHTEEGRTIELSVRAGVDTSEWAHERTDVRAVIKHERAPVFDTRPADTKNSFPANRYWARFVLGSPQKIARVEIQNLSHAATLALWRATLYDSHTGISTPLSHATRSAFWTTVYDHEGVQVIHNARALPRAWLVLEAVSVDDEEALHRIRGESALEFDPTRTALLEVKPDELPSLTGGALPPESSVRITNYEPNRLRIQTNSSTPTLLVVSEIFYPGWVATMDGQPTRIMLTDYLLRGVALPPGQHRIEMQYTAPAARTGALISALTLLLLCGLAVYARRKAGLERKHAIQTA